MTDHPKPNGAPAPSPRDPALTAQPATGAPDPLELFTDEEVAKMVKMSPRWVRAQRLSGRLPFRRLDPGPRGEVRMRRDDIEAWQRGMRVLVAAKEPGVE